MQKHTWLNNHSADTGNGVSGRAPMPKYRAPVKRLVPPGGSIRASYRNGRVRSLASGSTLGLLSSLPPFTGDPIAHAKNFLGNDDVTKALGLANVSLHDGRVDSFNFQGVKFSRVEMKQVIKIGDTELPVRGGFVHVAMDADGKVINVTNTVKFGRRPAKLPSDLKSESDAVEICRTKLGVASATGSARLVLSEHEGKLGLVYEVKVISEEPRHAMFYLVLARTGEIVHEHSLIRTSVTAPIQDAVNRIPVKCFLSIPTPKKPIPDQTVEHYIESLPDQKVLKDHRFIMLVQEGGKWVEVAAKDDGSFKFDSENAKESSKFSAVVTYVALRAQYEFLESLGMKKQDRPIKVFIDDPAVSDNAYFDPENYEIHMGVGSGGPFGLAKHISYDLGVEWHENGHHVVYLQTPGQDLPGSQGGAMHESTGDVLGQLVMQYLWGALYGEKLGNKLTVDFIKKDRRIIGTYALHPNGIREQRNKKTPKDQTGEVHDDGLISGGAHGDLLEAMIVKCVEVDGKTIVDGVTDFSKLYLGALALVPAHTVRFVDMLNAMITADNSLFGGKYKALIEKAHADHGIKPSKADSTDEPTEITIDIEGADEGEADATPAVQSLVSTKKPARRKTTRRSKKKTA